jgi:hypothetical protein
MANWKEVATAKETARRAEDFIALEKAEAYHDKQFIAELCPKFRQSC